MAAAKHDVCNRRLLQPLEARLPRFCCRLMPTLLGLYRRCIDPRAHKLPSPLKPKTSLELGRYYARALYIALSERRGR